MTSPSPTPPPRRLPKRVGPAAAAAIVMLALFAGLFAWRSARTAQPSAGAPPPTAVVAIQINPTDVPASLPSVGSLRAVREVVLAPEVAGRVVAIRFNSGDAVAAGSTLVQLYDAPERADRAAAVAHAKFTGVQLERSRQLATTGAEPRELLDQRVAEHDQALAAVSQIEARLAQKTIRAPFAGAIGLRKINPGQYLNPGDAIASLTALDQLYVDFSVPQQDFAKLRVGSPVSVTTDAWPGRTFLARVNAIEPQIGEDTRNITIQAVVANADRALRPGLFVTAALQLPPEHGVLVVPATAIQTSASGESVTVIRGPRAQQEGKAEIVPVTTGRRFGDSVVITGGLKPGDVVVTEGQPRVQPGAQVKVVHKPQPASR